MRNKQSGRVVAGVSSTRWKRFIKTAIIMSLMNIVAWALAYWAIILYFDGTLAAKVGAGGAVIVSVILFIFSWSMLKDRVSTPEPVVIDSRVPSADESVETILKGLPDGYMAFHDVTYRYGKGRRDIAVIEHVVVGPAGILVIETKASEGKVNVNEVNQILLDDQPFDFGSQVHVQVAHLKQLFARGTEPTFVNGLVVFTQAMVLVREPVNDLHYMNKGYLLQHIANQERNNKWSDEEVVLWQRTLAKIKNKKVS